MIELKSGSICMLSGTEPICKFNNVNGFVESDIEPYSMSKEITKFDHEATFSAETMECSPLMAYTTDLNPIYVEYSVPIMVQSRWHKKPRINKKWLKRYGMKKDSILAKARMDSITFDTERENQYELGYTMTLDKLHYEFRSDQLRKNLKMEMCYD